jgi:hypothetical protein
MKSRKNIQNAQSDPFKKELQRLVDPKHGLVGISYFNAPLSSKPCWFKGLFLLREFRPPAKTALFFSIGF